MALEAIYNYKMPAGQELSAVSLSWGLDEAETDPREMDATDKWMGALLEKVWPLMTGFAPAADPGRPGKHFKAASRLLQSRSAIELAGVCMGTSLIPNPFPNPNVHRRAEAPGHATWQQVVAAGCPVCHADPRTLLYVT